MKHFWALLLSLPLAAQVADFEIGPAAIVREGTRMAATAYAPKSASGKLPCILMAHGWGGTAASLRPDAIGIARAGYYVVAFDYRGWARANRALS